MSNFFKKNCLSSVSNADLCPENGKLVHLLVMIITSMSRKNYRETLRKRNDLQGRADHIKIPFLLGMIFVATNIHSCVYQNAVIHIHIDVQRCT